MFLRQDCTQMFSMDTIFQASYFTVMEKMFYTIVLIYAHTCAHTHACAHMRMLLICMHMYICIHTHTHTHACTHTCTHTHACTRTHTHAHARIVLGLGLRIWNRKRLLLWKLIFFFLFLPSRNLLLWFVFLVVPQTVNVEPHTSLGCLWIIPCQD